MWEGGGSIRVKKGRVTYDGIYERLLTFDGVELRGNSIAQKIEPLKDKLGNSNLLLKKSDSQKTLFDLPPPTLGTLAGHAHIDER